MGGGASASRTSCWRATANANFCVAVYVVPEGNKGSAWGYGFGATQLAA